MNADTEVRTAAGLVSCCATSIEATKTGVLRVDCEPTLTPSRLCASPHPNAGDSCQAGSRPEAQAGAEAYSAIARLHVLVQPAPCPCGPTVSSAMLTHVVLSPGCDVPPSPTRKRPRADRACISRGGHTPSCSLWFPSSRGPQMPPFQPGVGPPARSPLAQDDLAFQGIHPRAEGTSYILFRNPMSFAGIPWEKWNRDWRAARISVDRGRREKER